MSDYVTKEEFKKECKKINKRIDDIANNHLPTIYGFIGDVYDKVKDLKWFVMGGTAALGIVIAIIKVLG